MAFDGVTADPGSGGAVLMANVFTDTDAVERALLYSGLAYGAFDAIPTPVTTSAGLPVAQQGVWTVSITGVATAANQVTGNASLASIDGKITACNTGAVTVSSSALPTGAATAAKQPALGTAGTPSVDVITVQGRSGMTAVTVDGSGVTQPISGSVTANAGTNLNTSLLALESGGNLSAAATSLAVVDDWDESDRAKVNPIVGQAGVAGGSGTVSALTQRVVLATDVALPAGANAIGKLAANSGVDIGDVDVASIIPGTGATNLGKAIDTATGSTDTGVLSLATRDDALSTLTPAEGDNVQLRTDANGALWVIPSGSVAVTGTFWQATQPVSLASVPSHDVTNAGTFQVQVSGTALTRLTDIETNTDSLAITGNGAAATALRVSIANDSTGIVALTTSTASIGKLASNTGVTIGAVEIVAAQTLATVTTVGTLTTLTGGGIAHDSADSGNPVKVGSKAAATLSTATLVAADDRTNQVSDLDGAVIVRDSATAGDYVSAQATNTDGTSTQCLPASGSGVKTYLTDCTIANSSATAITVDIKDGSTVKWTFPVPAGGGVVFSWKTPLVGTANTAWNFDPSTAASTVSCSMSGFKSKI